jgi:ABC-type uncharacterized transport system ATPase subunit
VPEPHHRTATPLLEADTIVKRFGSFTALAGVDLAIEAGSIHAVLGENGAGKSTLMNVLSGLLRPTEGTLRRSGKPVQFRSAADAARAGIGMVHQHFLLVPPLTVAENLLLGAQTGNRHPLAFPIDAVRAEAQTLATQLGWKVPWDAPAGALPVGTQQRIEILKALRGNTEVLLFDEPTAVLTPTETPELFETLRALAASGRGIVFISHKLDEIRELADQVTVLRRGRRVLHSRLDTTDNNDLALAMVGADSEAASRIANSRASRGATQTVGMSPVRLRIESLGVGPVERPRLHDFQLEIRAGEIVAVAGVDGNGQEELVDCLSGMRRPDRGCAQAGDTPLCSAQLPPRPDRVQAGGVGIVPADRQKRGLALPMSIAENLALGLRHEAKYRAGMFLKWKALRHHASQRIADFDIRAEGPDQPVGALSGGNQQKVVIARALEGDPAVLIVVNPTRGLDVGAIAYVHDALRDARDRGTAILLVTTELDEALGLADRVAILSAGRIQGIVQPDTPRETIGTLMGGTA